MSTGKLRRDLEALKATVPEDVFKVLMNGMNHFCEHDFFNPERNRNAINTLAAIVFRNRFLPQAYINLRLVTILNHEKANPDIILGTAEENKQNSTAATVEGAGHLHFLSSMDAISNDILQLYAKVLREKLQEVYPNFLPKFASGSAGAKPFSMMKNVFHDLHPERDDVLAASFIYSNLHWAVTSGKTDHESINSAYMALTSGNDDEKCEAMRRLNLGFCSPKENLKMAESIAEMLKAICETMKIHLDGVSNHEADTDPDNNAEGKAAPEAKPEPDEKVIERQTVSSSVEDLSKDDPFLAALVSALLTYCRGRNYPLQIQLSPHN